MEMGQLTRPGYQVSSFDPAIALDVLARRETMGKVPFFLFKSALLLRGASRARSENGVLAARGSRGLGLAGRCFKGTVSGAGTFGGCLLYRHCLGS